MGLFKGKYQIAPYSQLTANKKQDKLLPADFQNSKFFISTSFSGSDGKRDGRFNYKPKTV